LFSPGLCEGQEQKTTPGQEGKALSLRDAIYLGLFFITLIGLFLNLYLFLKRKKETKEKKLFELEAEREFNARDLVKAAKTAEEIYCAALKERLGTIHLPGSPDIECSTVKLEDAFVSLFISESWRSDRRFHDPEKITAHEMERQRHLSPEQVMKRAFQRDRLLLVIGDPGSGKTTLLKYYAVICLDKIKRRYRNLGFAGEIMPIYYPLRDLEFKTGNHKTGDPVPLPEALAKWCEGHLLNISAHQFHDWLSQRETLVLLDGLDEIGSKERRQRVCQWIKKMCAGLKNARFVVTSRATGYRKMDGIELEMPHLRADIMDFSPQQQADFLEKWFRAAYLAELPPKELQEHPREWQDQQRKKADHQSHTIIAYLDKKENKTLRELAAVPMLLQIMAIIWKKHQYLPRDRTELYDVALNYLLDYRDRQKGIEPFLPKNESRRVLAPTALWMQEELQRDEAPKLDMHQTMQVHLNTLEGQPDASLFCAFLRDRAGIIADYDKEHYIFRHKSFREFLSGIRLKENAHEKGRIETLINHFKEDWWEECLRFFISNSDDKIFDLFMYLFFQSSVSKQLDVHQQNLLQLLVKEAPQKTTHSLEMWLNSAELNDLQRRYVMECLKTIGTPEALQAIKNADKAKMDKHSREYAEEIIAEAAVKVESYKQVPGPDELETLNSFRNPFEDNVEYIKIPGGTYNYSVTKENVTVPGLYFCKYPVTNKRYRKFINFLGGREKELERRLSLKMFAERLLAFAKTIDGYVEYLEKNPDKWQEQFRSLRDEDKKFNGDDQPVVSVTWYAARAYCFWLSCLEAAVKGNNRLEDISRLAGIYRLPDEKEWEWAAGGNPDGSVRPYPWPEDKGEPNPNLANYNQNVGATTPVGRYPQGATPHGLMDMAGNLWEWMENLYEKNEPWRSFRGGSWFDDVSALRCSARSRSSPDIRSGLWGCRVVRAQS
ncbi:MAG: SUMF1/EgtB/PvdO family nonheme iron enzyme, partial [Candidatus Aminicenantes bacterium]